MSAKTVQDMTRSAVLAGWGIATLVLMFVVVLLGYELYNRGERAHEELPLVAAIGENTAPSDPTGIETPVQLYFGSPYSSGLRAETRVVTLRRDTIANCKAVIAALAAGPRSDSVPVIANTARVRAIYLLGPGDLVVDLSRDVDVPGLQSASAELLMARALTMTLTQPALRAGDTPAIARVRFLFEGAPTGSHFPEHIKLEHPIEPESAWIVPSRTGTGNV